MKNLPDIYRVIELLHNKMNNKKLFYLYPVNSYYQKNLPDFYKEIEFLQFLYKNSVNSFLNVSFNGFWKMFSIYSSYNAKI